MTDQTLGHPTCEKTEKWGPGDFRSCGMPATSHSEHMGYLCRDHATMAMIALGDVRPLDDTDLPMYERFAGVEP